MIDFLIQDQFIRLDWAVVIQVIALGLIGGTLSGFIGSGGAFFMTPGMMNLGVPGPIAVASNITHKFGKAMVGARKHGEMGHVDKKLAVFMLITAAVGIRLAVFVMKLLFVGEEGGDVAHGAAAGAGANLYISLVFAIVLSMVSISMLRDILRSRRADDTQPSRRIIEFLDKLWLPPKIDFQIADVRVSLWVVLLCGLATGYLAGTIGVGGFIGVPAMIYVFGVPAAVAAGTELYLAMFMGAWGALNYGLEGMIDIRMTLLLYLGSLVGVYLGAYGTRVVREVFIRLTTACIILLCVLSRVIAVPVYLRQLGYIAYDPALDRYFNIASKVLLFTSGIAGAAIILALVFKAYLQRRRVQASLVTSRAAPAATTVTTR